MIVVAAILAVFIGMAVGILGGGGSILTTPLLIYVVGFDAKQAIAASLFVVGVTSIFGLIGHARAGRVVWRIELPLVRAGLVAAAALVAIDAWKELPITLLLRPFGTDTLSVWVWQATSESLWAQAAVPSLAIVVVGMVPVVLLLWALERGATVTS